MSNWQLWPNRVRGVGVGSTVVGAPTALPRPSLDTLPLDHPKFCSFFHSPTEKFVLFFPLWVSSRGILVVFLNAGTLKCHVWSLWLSPLPLGAPKLRPPPSGPSLFLGFAPLFFVTDSWKQTITHQSRKRHRLVTQGSHPAHLARPANRRSHSTSYEGVRRHQNRELPAAPMVDATARAAAHAKMEPHRRRQKCSARRRVHWVSPRALALANWVTKAWVSTDHESQDHQVGSAVGPTSSG